MKLMKLLLIGLLSVVALAACSEDEAATTPAAFSIVQVSDKGTPVLYDNVTVTLKALKDGAYVDTAIFTEADIVGATTNVSTGSATVKVTDPATGAGTITATIIITAGDTTVDPVVEEVKEVVTYTIAPANVAVTAITLSPDEDATLTNAAPDKTYKVEGTVGTAKVDVTADTVITPVTGLTIAGGKITATANITAATPLVFTFAALTAITKAVEATGFGTSTPTLVSIAVTGIVAGEIPTGTDVQLIATGTYTSGPTQVITDTVTWASSVEATAKFHATTKGLLVPAAAATATSTDITAALDGKTSPAIAITVSAAGSR